MKNASTPKAFSGPPAAGCVDVWMMDADALIPIADRLIRCLTPDEVGHCERALHPLSRSRSLITRAVLRHLLAAVTPHAPASLSFVRGERGKPSAMDTDVEFSVSHSRSLALFAFASRPVGVDVEHTRSVNHLHRTAARILHPDTVALLHTLDDEARTAAFLDAWTLREAHVKAVGGGLFHTPDELPFVPGLPAPGSSMLRAARSDGTEWSVTRLDAGADTHVAVVTRGVVTDVRLYDTESFRTLIKELQ
jgi:4'-phosphopantetheinyl transferase